MNVGYESEKTVLSNEIISITFERNTELLHYDTVEALYSQGNKVLFQV